MIFMKDPPSAKHFESEEIYIGGQERRTSDTEVWMPDFSSKALQIPSHDSSNPINILKSQIFRSIQATQVKDLPCNRETKFGIGVREIGKNTATGLIYLSRTYFKQLANFVILY